MAHSEVSVSSTRSLDIAALQGALSQALTSQRWVVVVYPKAKEAEAARRDLTALVPDGSSGGGRTTLLPGGGRISIVAANDPPFEPGADLVVAFHGWGAASSKEYEGMNAWRQRSSSVLRGEVAGGA